MNGGVAGAVSGKEGDAESKCVLKERRGDTREKERNPLGQLVPVETLQSQKGRRYFCWISGWEERKGEARNPAIKELMPMKNHTPVEKRGGEGKTTG